MARRSREVCHFNQALALTSCVLLMVFSAGCSVFFGAGNASVENMVAGGNLHDGELEVWLTLQFDEVPAAIDPRDVEVVFSGKALDGETRFDWEFISQHDLAKNPSGWGRHPITATTLETDPPLGQPLDVKFPLYARRRVEEGGNIAVKAELFWGGERQDWSERGINHLYKRDI